VILGDVHQRRQLQKLQYYNESGSATVSQTLEATELQQPIREDEALFELPAFTID